MVELNADSVMAEAVSLDNIDFAIDGISVIFACSSSCQSQMFLLRIGSFTAITAPGYAEANAAWEIASYIKDSAGRVYLRGLLRTSGGARPDGKRARRAPSAVRC